MLLAQPDCMCTALAAQSECQVQCLSSADQSDASTPQLQLRHANVFQREIGARSWTAHAHNHTYIFVVVAVVMVWVVVVFVVLSGLVLSCFVSLVAAAVLVVRWHVLGLFSGLFPSCQKHSRAIEQAGAPSA